MLGKRFSLRDSQTKSRFSFKLPDEPHGGLTRSVFRDPAALPMLRNIAEGLRSDGYEVRNPKLGKACHGYCEVLFPDVNVDVIMLVGRRGGKIEFEIMTWPRQTLRQSLLGRTLKSPDCEEWSQLCSAINSILSRDPRLESVAVRTNVQAEESTSLL
jgi:hypothetical protein